MSGDAKYISLYYNLVHQSPNIYKDLLKGHGGNMSYLSPWIPSSSGGSCISEAASVSTSAQQFAAQLESSRQLYEDISPTQKCNVTSSNSHHSSERDDHSMPKSSPSLIGSMASSSVAVRINDTEVPVSASSVHSADRSVTSSSYGHSRSFNPPKKVYSGESKSAASISSHRTMPDYVIGLAGPSSVDNKPQRKYIRRSPSKFPAPEQLPSPVLYSYQGRGRPRKHWNNVTPSLPTMVPIVHPSNSSDDTDDDDNKPFKCSLCSKSFKLKGGLQQHERTHGTDRPYICPDCGKLFRQPTHLQQHMRIHTGEKPYDCTFCDKSFRQRTILNQHLRIHTGEKPYVCMECGKQFRQKAILDQHFRTHLGEKPFACPHPSCRKHFREMATLISHMKCHKDVFEHPKSDFQQDKHLIKEEEPDIYNQHDEGPVDRNSSEVLSNHFRSIGAEISAVHSDNEAGSVKCERNLLSSAAISNETDHERPSHFSEPSTSPGRTDTGQSYLENSQNDQSPIASSASSQMAMANLIPYPHTIFPSTSYMISAAPDHRQYQSQTSQALHLRQGQ